MITLRKADARGHAHHGWLESWHSFSFADYHDPAHVHFGTGFDTHGHRDMEIVTYILSGRLRHRDSMGNGEDIHAGEIQLMRAGSGVRHSEFNPSDSEAVHLLQIWIMPDEQGLAPGYWQKIFPDEAKRGRWCLLVSPDAAGDSLHIHQDARLSSALLDGAETLDYPIAAGRNIYLHIVPAYRARQPEGQRV